MKALEERHRRGIGTELAHVCERLHADEVEILAKALRRGVLEIYKAVVLHDLETGHIDRREASRLLGGRVVERAIEEKRATRRTGGGASPAVARSGSARPDSRQNSRRR